MARYRNEQSVGRRRAPQNWGQPNPDHSLTVRRCRLLCLASVLLLGAQACEVYDPDSLEDASEGPALQRADGPIVYDSASTTTACLTPNTPCTRTNAEGVCLLDGSCALSNCTGAFANCDNDASTGCEVSTETQDNCGQCHAKCSFNNASATCIGGECQLADCNAGYADCNDDPADGCERSLNNITDCGRCQNRCVSAPHALPSCQAQKCVYTCESGWDDCNDDAGDGCETAVTSTERCSTTTPTTSCPTGFNDCNGDAADGCEVQGSCPTTPPRTPVPPEGCPAGQTACGDTCVSLTSDVDNCGACDNQCSVKNGTASCSGGKCGRAHCDSGFDDCNGNAADGCETDTGSSNANCGACGNTCSAGDNVTSASCSAGSCSISCKAGWADCDANAANGCETDTRDDNNCGGCNMSCGRANASASCATGRCTLGSCNPGFGDCDNNPDTGCEKALSDVNNCGACGHSCNASNGSAHCENGECKIACNDGWSDCDGDPDNGCETDIRGTCEVLNPFCVGKTAKENLNCGACGRTCTALIQGCCY
jgi:hypothetical protein